MGILQGLAATVLFATTIFCSLATVAFGLWPALRLSPPDLVLSGLFVRGAAAGASANPGFDVGPLAIA